MGMKKQRHQAGRFSHLPRFRYGSLDVPVATDPLSRLRGLAFLDRRQAGPGLLIPRCRCIHSFGMRFPLRIVFLDRHGRPLRRIESLPPRRFGFCPRAHSVLELVPESEP